MDRIIGTTFDLLGKYPFERITVGRICSEAGIGRATFYRSFDSKTAVIDAYLDRMMGILVYNAEQADDGTWNSYKDYMGSIFTTMYGCRIELMRLYDNGLLDHV